MELKRKYLFSYLDRLAECFLVSYANSDEKRAKSKITRVKGREEASVTTFALVVTRVFVYSASRGRRGTAETEEGVCRRRQCAGVVCNRRAHTRTERVHVHMCACTHLRSALPMIYVYR